MTRQALQYSYTLFLRNIIGDNRQKFGALLQSIIGNFKSIIGSSLNTTQGYKYKMLFK